MGTANSSERSRRWKQRKRQEWAAGPKIPCICGCGTLIPAINALGKPARYAWGHNPGGEATRFIKGQIAHNKGKPNPKAVEIHKGKTLSPAELAQRTATRFAKYGAYHSPDGMRRILTHSPEWYEHLVRALRQRDYAGAKNPFYGKTHSPETRALLTLKLSGPNNPNWNGGVATLPYGPEFTRRFKRLIRGRDGNKCQ